MLFKPWRLYAVTLVLEAGGSAPLQAQPLPTALNTDDLEGLGAFLRPQNTPANAGDGCKINDFYSSRIMNEPTSDRRIIPSAATSRWDNSRHV